jgi:hypothetical protein
MSPMPFCNPNLFKSPYFIEPVWIGKQSCCHYLCLCWITEEHYSDQGFLKGVGNVTNNQTYISTYLSNELIQSTGNGTFETPDGQSIAWISSSIGRPVDGRWVFCTIILFNNTQSASLSLLNNRIALSNDTAGRDTAGNEPNYIWLLE